MTDNLLDCTNVYCKVVIDTLYPNGNGTFTFPEEYWGKLCYSPDKGKEFFAGKAARPEDFENRPGCVTFVKWNRPCYIDKELVDDPAFDIDSFLDDKASYVQVLCSICDGENNVCKHHQNMNRALQIAATGKR